MRRDMVKVLTERTRAGGGDSGRLAFNRLNRTRERYYVEGYEDVEEDCSPKFESIRKPHKTHYSGKSFTDLLGPLQAYLRKQVGRPWDDVWSDICKVMKGNGSQANHLKDHVRMEVAGIPHSGRTRFAGDAWHRPDGYTDTYGVFSAYGSGVYVDEDGIVRLPEDYRKEQKTKVMPCVECGKADARKVSVDYCASVHTPVFCGWDCRVRWVEKHGKESKFGKYMPRFPHVITNE